MWIVMTDSNSAYTDPLSSSTQEARTFSYRGELLRKGLHLLALVVPLGMVMVEKSTALWILIPVALLMLAADVLRAYHKGFNQLVGLIFSPMMRPVERDPNGTIVINGATWVMTSAALLALIFPLQLAAVIFAMFMVADAAAALVGRRYGRTPLPGTDATVEGSIAFLFTALVIMAAISPLSFGLSLLGAVVACVAEALPLRINDNVAVPLLAAAVIAFVQTLVLGQPVALFW